MICRLLFLRLAIGVLSMGLALNYLAFIAQPGFSAPALTSAPTAEADRLLQAGQQSLNQQQFPLALKHLQAALALYRQQRNQAGEGKTLEGLGDVYYAQQEYRTAIEFHQQALVIWRQTDDRQHQAIVLDVLGLSHFYLGELQNALAYFDQALPLWHVAGNSPEDTLRQREGEANTLNNIGLVYDALGEKQTALDYYNQALPILRAVVDSPEQRLRQREGEANTLNNIGRVYDDLGEKQTALDYYNQALSIWRVAVDSPEQKLRQREGEANTLNNIGLVHDTLGEKKTALDYYNQALIIWQAVSDRRGEANTLSNIGAVYNALGERQTALKYYNQALPLQRAVSDQAGEAITLNNIGLVYDALNEKQAALKYYNQSLPILRLVGDRAGEATTLCNIGAVYDALDEKQTALKYYNQALPILGAVGDRAGQARALNNIGRVYSALNEKQTALDYYNQALPLWYAVGHREGAARTLNNMGLVLTAQNQPQLAIVFYKRSVNVYETIRAGVSRLPRESQESYTQTIAETYRSLADLLIQQGRIAEAQQVIELLKVQELNDLDPAQRTNPTRLAELALNPLEQEIQTKHGNLIAFGAKVRACEQNCQPLEAQLQQLRANFKTYTANIQTALDKAKLERAFVRIDGRNKDFNNSASKIVNAQPGTILIYPLVLPDKIHLLWAAQGGILSSSTCPLGESQLNTAVTAFQRALVDRTDLDGVKQHGKTLYDCLIKPLEEKGDWDKNKIQNLVIAADRTINYIPIGALYDGKQFLIERYTISNIINAELTDVSTKLPANPTILGLGISDSLDGLPALPNVPAELNTIIRSATSPTGLYPGDLNLNQTATLARFRSQLAQNPYNIVHIATHGQFNPTKPDDSFLLFSSGKPNIGDLLTVDRIQQEDNLRKVHLVVLSACQTASGQSSTSGIEIQRLSDAFVRDRAKAVIASLWSVSDASTTVLMQQFYKNLAQGMTKSEALRQAQLSLLTTKTQSKTKDDRGVVQPLDPNQQTRKDQSPPGYSHPYYWAPFILIGNGL